MRRAKRYAGHEAAAQEADGARCSSYLRATLVSDSAH